MNDKIIIVTTENHNTVVENNKEVVLDFWAEWCGPCKAYGMIVDRISSERSDISIGKVDCDSENDLVAKYGIKSIPTTLFLKNGEVVERKIGVVSEGDLNKIIDNLIL